MNKETIKRIGNILQNGLLYLFLTVCVLAVLLTLFSKKDADGTAEIFGYQMRVVTSDSMAECEHTDVSEFQIKHIPIRSMVFVRVMPEDVTKVNDWYRSLQVGDVLTFRYVYTNQVTITHRITSITEKDTGGFIIELAGDNTNSTSGQLYQTIDTSIPNNTNYVIGKVTGQSYLFGLVMSLLMTRIGVVLAIILPCLVIILLEVIKMARVLTADKKAREREDLARAENELNELRRRVLELESEKREQPSVSKDNKEDETK